MLVSQCFQTLSLDSGSILSLPLSTALMALSAMPPHLRIAFSPGLLLQSFFFRPSPDVPLRFDQGLHDVPRPGAKGHGHGPGAAAPKESQGTETGQDGAAGLETGKAL